MKQNYIKPETEIIELDTLDIICESGGQVGEGDAKRCKIFYIEDFDDPDDWSYNGYNEYKKSIFED